MQQLESSPEDRLMAEQNFLMNTVHSIQNQLENLKRDSRSVSGVNTCFYYITHVQNTLPNLGFQLWGNRRLVNEEFYANKPACIEPNVEILEFMMKEHDPRGIPDDIQNISDMVEMALLADSMHDLVDKTPGLGATEMKAGPQCSSDKIRLPRESAGNGQTLDPCIYRLTSMEIHEMLGHMGGGKGFPPWLNMGCAMITSKIGEQCLHERHMEDSRQQQCRTKIGRVWNGTVMYFGVSAQGGYRYAAVFEDLESGQLETFTIGTIYKICLVITPEN
jgi:hypothetical protein